MDGITLVTKEDIEASWRWLHSSLSARPTTPCGEFVFDHKSWNGPGCCGPLTQHENVVCCLGNLYLASVVADLDDIFRLVASGVAQPVVYHDPTLDEDLAVVVRTEHRFRNHLAEHISFWVRLATEPYEQAHAPYPEGHPFGHTRPNIQPEDKGPDGLFLSLHGESPSVELLSVKNTIGDPQALISRLPFRINDRIGEDLDRKLLLEEFYLIASGKTGFLRLVEKLTSLCKQLGVTANQKRAKALLTEAYYNGVIVADERHAHQELFAGYRHVVPDPKRCIATYIGSEAWRSLAERVRDRVDKTLKAKGLL